MPDITMDESIERCAAPLAEERIAAMENDASSAASESFLSLSGKYRYVDYRSILDEREGRR